MSDLGTEHNPLRVAVVGSGPSGFYATEALIKSDVVAHIDLFERLPSPFGLVRSGVAPDHPKLKQAIGVYHKIAQMPQCNFIGNVTVGKDLSVEQLRDTHHAVIFTCGAETDRTLGIPGEGLPGSHTATEFVGWYNGHPDYRDRHFDLSHEVAVVIGQGNVAADVSRILAKTVDELKHTDIAEHALEVLAESNVREIHVIGRRGPAQAKFTPKELREFAELADCDPQVAAEDLILNAESQTELEEKTNVTSAKVYKLFQEFAARESGTKKRRCRFRFLMSPVELLGNGGLQKVVLEHNQLAGEPFQQSARGTGRMTEQPAGILFRSIGYRGVALEGVPFDERKGIFPNVDGRVIDNGVQVPGVYASGWIKRGPTGIIGTNRADSVATVQALLEDLDKLDARQPKAGAEALARLLQDRGLRAVSYSDWQQIDAEEVRRGQPKGKPREKFTRRDEMLAVLA